MSDHTNEIAEFLDNAPQPKNDETEKSTGTHKHHAGKHNDKHQKNHENYTRNEKIFDFLLGLIFPVLLWLFLSYIYNYLTYNNFLSGNLLALYGLILLCVIILFIAYKRFYFVLGFILLIVGIPLLIFGYCTIFSPYR